MHLIFKNKPTADTILQEIAVTPFGLVILWAGAPNPDFAFDSTPNVVSYIQGADGRCAIAHPWSEEDQDWLEAYLADWIASGDAQVLDALPENWQYPQSEHL